MRNPDYIRKQISRIAAHGDDARWRIASHCDLFSVEDLDPTGKLTDSQRTIIDEFVATYR